MINSVIFDMDGVLIDAKDWHYEALNRALLLFGYQINRYDHLTTFDGLPTRRKLQILSKERHLPEKLHEFINEMKQRYTMEIVNAKCKPRFNHQYALSKLKSEGYRIAVASNSVRSSIDVMMKRAELDQYLEFTISNEDVISAKPDPEMYNLAIKRLGVSATDCLIVEDNENGIRAARAAGAHVLEVTSVDDVTWTNLSRKISSCNSSSAP